ncbi:MAG: lamin tail domain-containing protein [Alphaproteobacteria bacterium]|nr:lamin tail domain-containing protein [Alphaproteobacteria bacterium]
MVAIWLALLGCQEVGVTVLPPGVEFVSPVEGGLFVPGPVSVCAAVDFSGDVSVLAVELVSDVDGVLATDGFGPCDGGELGVEVPLSDATQILTITVTDASGRSGSDTITLTPAPNTTPTCTITSPTPNTVFADGEQVGVTVRAEDAEGDPLALSLTSSVDGLLETVPLPGPGSTSFDLLLASGPHDLTVKVEDPRGAVGSCGVHIELSICQDADGDGFDVCDGDCDDSAPHSNPAAIELPDGQDNDCDGIVDEGTALSDDDGDGLHELEGDCDDTDASIHPGATEIPDDSIDQDCDGTDAVTCFVDGDGDGYGSTATLVAADGDCESPGESETSDDCDDTNASVSPGAAEIPADGIDQDCDGTDPTGCYQDLDGDGYGTSIVLPANDADCDDPQESSFRTDCDDGDPAIHPGAVEILADGEDQDCNGSDAITCFEDNDYDGFGSDETVTARDGSCDTADNESAVDTDCNDANAAIHPGATEVPGDGVDQDCDGTDGRNCFVDDDDDGYGTNATIPSVDADCLDAGEAPVNGDCSDQDPTVHPGGIEIPDDLIDQDCSGDDTVTCYDDGDRDGYGTSDTLLAADGSCDTAQSEADVDGDCDDTNPSVYPGADDSNAADGIDANCDGQDGYGGDDADGDGSSVPDDCDDTNPAVHPGAPEVRDSFDNDCDGKCDEGLILAGDLVITEIMVTPRASAPTKGEWLEIFNPTGVDIALCDGWTLSDDGLDSLVLPGDVVVPAGGYIVAGTNASITQNGGVLLDFAYDRAFLAISAPDELYLDFDGLRIDGVTWLAEPGDGAAWQLDGAMLDAVSNDTPANWCDAATPWPGSAGDDGSPGVPNPVCP